MLIDSKEGCAIWENVVCSQIRAVGPLPLLYRNTVLITFLDWKTRLSLTDLRNNTGLSVQ